MTHGITDQDYDCTAECSVATADSMLNECALQGCAQRDNYDTVDSLYYDIVGHLRTPFLSTTKLCVCTSSDLDM